MMDYSRLTPAVERAASIAVSKFPAHYDISDVKQEIWVWVMERKNVVTRILADSDGSDAALIDLMVKAANEYLKSEDAAVYGYDEEDQFNFPLDMIKSILEVVFRHEDWQSFAQAAQEGMPRAKSEPATGGNNLASYADVSRAITSLPEDQYNLLVWRYKYNETFEQIGAHVGISRQAAQQRHEGAVSAIQQCLGKRDLGELRNASEVPYRPGNAASRARNEHDYEG
jgi:DNA-directed RNA polymerase specialized sigma24 family protein